MCAWTIDYVNLNNDMSISISKSHKNLIQLERDIFEMNIKQEINVPPLQDFISTWFEKQLVAVI